MDTPYYRFRAESQSILGNILWLFVFFKRKGGKHRIFFKRKGGKHRIKD